MALIGDVDSSLSDSEEYGSSASTTISEISCIKQWNSVPCCCQPYGQFGSGNYLLIVVEEQSSDEFTVFLSLMTFSPVMFPRKNIRQFLSWFASQLWTKSKYRTDRFTVPHAAGSRILNATHPSSRREQFNLQP